MERGEIKMKRIIIFALVLLGAIAPVASVAEAHWDDACHCNEIEAPERRYSDLICSTTSCRT